MFSLVVQTHLMEHGVYFITESLRNAAHGEPLLSSTKLVDICKREIFFEREIFEDPKTLEDASNPEVGSLFDREFGDVFPIKDDRPSGWLLETIDQIDQRGFPASIWSDKSNCLSLLDVEIDTIDDMIISEMSCKIFDSEHGGCVINKSMYRETGLLMSFFQTLSS